MTQDKQPPIVPAVNHNPIRLAVLISGGGTTLINLLDKIDAGTLTAEIATVICSNQKAYDKINEKLTSRGLQPPFSFGVHKIARKECESTAQFSGLIFDEIRSSQKLI